MDGQSTGSRGGNPFTRQFQGLAAQWGCRCYSLPCFAPVLLYRCEVPGSSVTHSAGPFDSMLSTLRFCALSINPFYSAQVRPNHLPLILVLYDPSHYIPMTPTTHFRTLQPFAPILPLHF